MNYLQNAALFIEVAATVAMAPVAAQAQTCANSSQTPLIKARLDQIATSQGISLAQVGVKFETFALYTLRPGNPIPPNKGPNSFLLSPLRQAKTGIANVQPDGVVPLVVSIIPFLNPQTYLKSVFYESKAVKYTLLPPSYQDYQILGFLDVLGSSSAHAAGENPAIVFMTTSDVRRISPKTITEANARRVGVWHSIGCEVTSLSGDLQMGEAVLRNPIAYVRTGRFLTGYGGPGSIGKL